MMAVEADANADLLDRVLLTPAELSAMTSEAVHREVRSPVASFAPIDYDWGSPATAGLWRADVREAADTGPLVYSYFVKLLRHIRLWPGLVTIPTDALRAEMVSRYPWQFELDIYESGIGAVLPDGMRTPALHLAKPAGDDHIALWWEFITQRPGPWQLDDYRRAAHLLGRLAARRRAGAAVNDSLPAIARDPSTGSALRYYTQTRVIRGVLPALAEGSLWRHPLLANALHDTSDPGLPAAMLDLAGRLPQILDMLDELPQTHAHGDASPQNLLLPANEPGTVVVIDWGFGTLLPIGFDLGQLLVGLAHTGQTDATDLATIDAVIMPGYLEGLAAEGYDARLGDVRAGYIGGMAARSALVALPFELLSSPLVTEDVQALIVQRVRLTRVLVDMAAEIRWATDVS
jgi:hypothetical protein